jgi:hypothetical protein
VVGLFGGGRNVGFVREEQQTKKKKERKKEDI